ncbi:hypothetical protein Ahy_B10g104103 [Arachis hypogaea]|uniref:60S ribosomal export protein NMD3 n=1 Tax=Arachis hypogaea TaxID=3818 RepID=A0A444X4Q4_ARAHY|nr:hypothetical protein Ahy_B10g104103 [Arachis hypogaea]
MVHVDFIWTEPYSKRIKVIVKVQKEILNGVILEQSYLVVYIQRDQMCESCSWVQANSNQWVTALILKHDAAVSAIRINETDQGIDLFFSNRSQGIKFVVFLGEVVHVRRPHDISIALLDSFTLTHCFLDVDH